MIPMILAFISLASVISNTNSSNIKSIIRNEVSGENATVKSEVTNVVNQNVTRVESNQPGEIKVEVKNGEVKVETSPAIIPTITTFKVEESTSPAKGFFSFFDELFQRISKLFVFGS